MAHLFRRAFIITRNVRKADSAGDPPAQRIGEDQTPIRRRSIRSSSDAYVDRTRIQSETSIPWGKHGALVHLVLQPREWASDDASRIGAQRTRRRRDERLLNPRGSPCSSSVNGGSSVARRSTNSLIAKSCLPGGPALTCTVSRSQTSCASRRGTGSLPSDLIDQPFDFAIGSADAA